MKDIKKMIFLIIQFFIYISFIFLDIHNDILPGASSKLKYSAIIFCVLFSTVENIKNMHRLSLLNIALVFAAIADIFLLFTSYYAVGICLFIFVQICYYKVLWKTNRYLAKILFLCIAVAILVTMILEKFEIDFQISSFIAFIYFTFLLVNLIIAIKKGIQSHKKKDICFAVAILLLLFCDLNVGLHNIQIIDNSVATSLIASLKTFSNIGMWIFYLPSQVIITMLSLGPFYSYDDKKDIE